VEKRGQTINKRRKKRAAVGVKDGIPTVFSYSAWDPFERAFTGRRFDNIYLFGDFAQLEISFLELCVIDRGVVRIVEM